MKNSCNKFGICFYTFHSFHWSCYVHVAPWAQPGGHTSSWRGSLSTLQGVSGFKIVQCDSERATLCAWCNQQLTNILCWNKFFTSLPLVTCVCNTLPFAVQKLGWQKLVQEICWLFHHIGSIMWRLYKRVSPWTCGAMLLSMLSWMKCKLHHTIPTYVHVCIVWNVAWSRVWVWLSGSVWEKYEQKGCELLLCSSIN